MIWTVLITFLISFVIGYLYGREHQTRRIMRQMKENPSFSFTGKVKEPENPRARPEDGL